MEFFQKKMGETIREIRRKRGLSLDRVSDMTGVSKAMLGQIERGESSPTVTTLWKIATGLQVSFSSLLHNGETEVSVVEKKEVIPIVEEDGAYRVFPIFPFDPRKRFEIFIVELDGNSVHRSEKHHDGTEEYITVLSGTLLLEIGQETYELTAEKSIRFAANLPHAYINHNDKTVKFQLVIYYP